MEPGDICLADLNEERRRHVLVLSVGRFERVSERVIVAPQVFEQPEEVPLPWRIEVDGMVFAVDLLRSMPLTRVLDRVGRAPQSAMARAAIAVHHILLP
jgi:mRNA-degrading endonuclease toxin of MazEF toxin-antitoxin module